MVRSCIERLAKAANNLIVFDVDISAALPRAPHVHTMQYVLRRRWHGMAVTRTIVLASRRGMMWPLLHASAVLVPPPISWPPHVTHTESALQVGWRLLSVACLIVAGMHRPSSGGRWRRVAGSERTRSCGCRGWRSTR